MDTSIVNIIRHSAIVQHKKDWLTYLVNNTTWYVLAEYKDWKWYAWNTIYVTLRISNEDLEHSNESEWRVID